MGLTYAILYVVTAVLTIALYAIQNRVSYWQKRGVPYEEPSFLFGSLKGFTGNRPVFELIRELYRKYKSITPFCGFFTFYQPTLLVMDLELIKRILIKDFNSFTDRGIFHNDTDPLSSNVFSFDGPKWRQQRNKVTYAFTSGKMKYMFPKVVEVGHRLAKVLSEMAEKNPVVEMKDILARFTTDVIGNCAFGVQCNSLKEPNVEFRVFGKKFFTSLRRNSLALAFGRSYPKLLAASGFRTTPADVLDFFMRVIRDTVEYRERNHVVQKDFIDMLIELKNSSKNGDLTPGLTIDELAGLVFLFFIAGYETSSTNMGFVLYELSLHQDIQDRLRKEVKDVLVRYDNVLRYECMREMHYMDQVICETLRKYTIIPTLLRQATKDYVILETGFKIERGTVIVIPADAIHHDPAIYPDP